MPTCCGCMRLKAGSYLAGGYALTLSVLVTLSGIFLISQTTPTVTVPIDELEKEYPQYTREELEKIADVAVDSAMDIYRIALWIALSLFVLWFLFSILLLVGVAKSNRACLLTWVIYTIILTVVIGLGIIGSLINAKTTFTDGSKVGGFVVNILVFLINIYAIWCVKSHRDELLEAPNNWTNVQDINPNSYRYVPNKV